MPNVDAETHSLHASAVAYCRGPASRELPTCLWRASHLAAEAEPFARTSLIWLPAARSRRGRHKAKGSVWIWVLSASSAKRLSAPWSFPCDISTPKTD
ncbi:hypothetical protein AK812_SmicGene6307 [Symbiodinium microadriaticum]|uniref:Uncharacterized protein n=1 Tax=Symbiodinium microadriaticum TaxID=2951 RepID=A0A1Q9ERG4_SYMMI|nr:hypothetical protein AK812_SmicGene6307 [Symbiodinium microadriaticum]